MKVHKLIINLPLRCTICKDKKSCDFIEEANGLLKSFKKNITKNAIMRYNKNKALFYGHVGTGERNPVSYWVELKCTGKKVRGTTTMIYVPPDEEGVCSEMKEEHRKSYA